MQNVPRAEITHTIDVWALVEIVSSIIAVCLPNLRTFVRRHTRGNGAQRLNSKSSSENRSVGMESAVRTPSPCEKRLVHVDGKWMEFDEERDTQAIVYVARPEDMRRIGKDF